MKTLVHLLYTAFFLYFTNSLQAQELPPIKKLELLRAYPIVAPYSEPSGITLYQNELYFVSDNHNFDIFKIVFAKDSASIQIQKIPISPPKGTSKRASTDLEGITHDGKGNFYLISEELSKILCVEIATGRSFWMQSDSPLEQLAAPYQLLQMQNAKIEGITLLPNGTFLLAAERSDRGLIALGRDAADKQKLHFQWALHANQSRIPESLRKKGSIDFADIFYHQEKVYVLDRNAQSVVRIAYKDNTWEEEDFWHYGEAEAQFHQYPMGLAEGLCIDGAHIYIVTDNGSERDREKKPMLMIFQKPSDF